MVVCHRTLTDSGGMSTAAGRGHETEPTIRMGREVKGTIRNNIRNVRTVSFIMWTLFNLHFIEQ